MTPGKRVDGPHAEIRDALRKCGYVVIDCSAFGHGFPDLLAVDKAFHIHLLEVKADDGELTPKQVKFFAQLRGCPVHVVRNIEQALAALEVTQ